MVCRRSSGSSSASLEISNRTLLKLEELLLLALLLPLLDESRHGGHKLARPFIGEQTDECTPGQGDGSQADGKAPFLTIKPDNLEGAATEKDDEDLAADHDQVDANEPHIAGYALEDVGIAIETAVVEFVEDLEPDKGVEYESVETGCFVLDRGVVAEKLGTGEVEDKGDG